MSIMKIFLLSLLLFSCQNSSSNDGSFVDEPECDSGQSWSASLGVCFDPKDMAKPVPLTEADQCSADGQQWLEDSQTCVDAAQLCEDCETEVVLNPPKEGALDLEVTLGKFVNFNGQKYVSIAHGETEKRYLAVSGVSEEGFAPLSSIEVEENETVLTAYKHGATMFIFTSDRALKEIRVYKVEANRIGLVSQPQIYSGEILTSSIINQSFSFLTKQESVYNIYVFNIESQALEIYDTFELPPEFKTIEYRITSSEIQVAGQLRKKGTNTVVPAVYKGSKGDSLTLEKYAHDIRVELRKVLWNKDSIFFIGEIFGESGENERLERNIFIQRNQVSDENYWQLVFGGKRREEVIAAGINQDHLYLTGLTQGSFVKDYNYGSPSVYALKVGLSNGAVDKVFQTVNDLWEIPHDLSISENGVISVLATSIDREIDPNGNSGRIVLYKYQ